MLTVEFIQVADEASWISFDLSIKALDRLIQVLVLFGLFVALIDANNDCFHI